MIRLFAMTGLMVTLAVCSIRGDDTTFEISRMQMTIGDPITALPKQVVSADAQLTLFADFSDKDEKGVAVYVVNRTSEPVALEAQDGDIYLKLEYESEPGQWQRAQPHAFSWCGNSYMSSPAISGNSFIVVRGYVPREGKAATVRYALYEQAINVHSNVGNGITNDEDVRKAANDFMTLKHAKVDFVCKVALSEIELKNEMDHIRDMRYYAIRKLGDSDFDDLDVNATLQSIIDRNEDKYALAARTSLAERATRAATHEKHKE